MPADHCPRRRRLEFLDFMNQVVAAHPDRDLHIIWDNLSTHKPKDDAWLRAPPRVTLHCTPTHASWLHPNRSLVQRVEPGGVGGGQLYQPRAVATGHG